MKPVTVADIDRALENVLTIIENMPGEDRLWTLFDKLEDDREKLLASGNRVEAARRRIKSRLCRMND